MWSMEDVDSRYIRKDRQMVVQIQTRATADCEFNNTGKYNESSISICNGNHVPNQTCAQCQTSGGET